MLTKLKHRAKLNRRSLNSEIVKNLEVIITSTKIKTNILLEKARRMRSELGIKINEKLLIEHKNESRA